MKITNKLGLPTPFVSMAQSDYQYTEGRYSVTSLLKGLKEMMLERRHSNEIEQDVSDMIWLLFGQAVHSILENSQEEQHQFKEVKLAEEVNGRVVSGIFDLYDGKTETIDDYKTCSVWKVIFGDFTDWQKQVNILSYLLIRAGFPVKQARIIAIMKDHSKSEAARKPDYPQMPVQIITFRIDEPIIRETEAMLISMIDKIKKYEQFPDDYIPPCTPEERYNSGDKFAVIKDGRKTALRVLDSKESAAIWIADNVDLKDMKKVTIKKRPGEDKKCAEYCRVSEFCHYWKRRQLCDKIKAERG